MTEFIKWAQQQYDALEEQRVRDPESLAVSAAIICYAQVLKKAEELNTPVLYALVEKAYVVHTEQEAQALMRRELPGSMRPAYTIVKVIP
jgi:hypothetical protein